MPGEVYSLVAIKGCDENRATAPESNSRTDQMLSIKVGSFFFGYKTSKLENLNPKYCVLPPMYASQAMSPA